MRAAIRAAGGLKALADGLGKRANTVSNWINRGAPTEECPAIQELTGVRCEVLRPSVDWEQFRRVLCAAHRQMLEASDDAQPPVGTIPVRPISND
jgi:DNA-binding transcriptional regulator YdaS (Cro superfamily)